MMQFLILISTTVRHWNATGKPMNRRRTFFTIDNKITIARIFVHDLPCMLIIYLFVIKEKVKKKFTENVGYFDA